MAHGYRTSNGRLAEAEEGKCGRPLRGGTRRGEPCTQLLGYGTDHPGEGACRFHGGLTPRGAASPAFKHGRYSKHWASVGEKMEGAISDLASDPDYLHLRRHIATLDFLFLEELGAMDNADGGGGWARARALTVDLQMAISGGNVAGIQRSLKQLRTLADAGVRKDKALDRIQSLLRDRATLTRADQARVEAEKAYATVDQLKDIALMSATSIASQLDLFTRQLMALLSEPERLRIREPFDRLRRTTLQGVSESFRRALVGQVEPQALTPGGNGAGSPPIEAEVVREAPDPDPAHTQGPGTGPGSENAAKAPGSPEPGAAKAVPIPGV